MRGGEYIHAWVSHLAQPRVLLYDIDALKRNTAPTASEKFNKTLNEIQVQLEEIVSSVQTREGEVST